MKQDELTETHPLFPSGEWEGFYTHEYGPGADRHPMHFVLFFKNGTVHGEGSDPVGVFSWNGVYDIGQKTCNMRKQYLGAHAVDYAGHADESGIWGNWNIRQVFKGGFHIWPKKIETEEEQLESMTQENVVKTKDPRVVYFEQRAPVRFCLLAAKVPLQPAGPTYASAQR